MTYIADQFQGGLQPFQDFSQPSIPVDTRRFMGACRIKGIDAFGRPIIAQDSAGDVRNTFLWRATRDRPNGAWSHATPVVGSSPVSGSKASFSSPDAVANAAAGLPGVVAANGAAGAGGPSPKDGPGFFGNDSIKWKKIDGQPYYYDPAVGTWRGLEYNTAPFPFSLNAPAGGAFITFPSSPGGSLGYQVPGLGIVVPGSGGGGAAGAAGQQGQGGAVGAAGAVRNGQRQVTPTDGQVTISTRAIRGEYHADQGLSPESVALPPGWPSIAGGSVGTVIAGTEHLYQAPTYLHGDPRLVCVNEGADPSASSIVMDTDGSGNLNPGLSAPLHSAWRVVRPVFTKSASGARGTLAWQMARGERDGIAGYGAIVDTSKAGRGPAVVTPSETSPNGGGGAVSGSPTGIPTGYFENKGIIKPGVLGDFATPANPGIVPNSVASPILAQDPADKPRLTVALTSARAGGPIEVGHGKSDKHRVGSSGDNATNAAHISTDAIFYADATRDAPIDFEPGTYPQVDEYTMKSRVHFQYDPRPVHSIPGKSGIPGKWRWWTTVPYVQEGGPPTGKDKPKEPRDKTPGDQPTPVRPPTDKTPTEPTPPTPTTPSDPGTPITPPDPTDPAVPPGGYVFNKTDGIGPQDGPAAQGSGNPINGGGSQGGGYTGPVIDPAGGIPVPYQPGLNGGLGSGLSGLAKGRDQKRALLSMTPRQDTAADPDTTTVHPGVETYTVQTWKPQSQGSGVIDIRELSNAPSASVVAQSKDRPTVLRAEAFGQQVGGVWTKTTRSGASRFVGGTANGGIVYMPPENDILDVGRTTGLPPSTSTSYVATYPGVYFASGQPSNATGGIVTGYRWGCNSTGAFTLEKMNASGAAATVITCDTSGNTAFGGIIDAGTHLIHNVVDPAAAQDADTKAARDAAIAVETARATAAEVALAAADALALAKSANLSDVASVATSRTNLGVGTGDSPQFAGVNVGHATDTTITRTGAGDIAVEGKGIYRVDGTDVSVADGGTGASTTADARTNLGLGSVATLTADPDTTLAANTDNNVATQKATKAYVDAAVAAVGGNPTGTIIMFGSVTAPTGYLSCDGTSYLRATYAALFAVIGTTFGAVDGTHFNVPNLDNAFPQGEGSSNTIGGTGGAVSPTITDPGHSHIVGQATDIRNGGASTADNASPTNAATTGISIADARPPFLSVAFFIKT